MPIQLDKILTDIAEEKVLHPNYPSAAKKEVDDAWARVGKNNKLSVHEARSIFKVLQKKYEQEKAKSKPSWKLFGLMDQIHQKVKPKEEVKEEDDGMLSMEEDEEYEMLEVQEEDEPATPQPSSQHGKSTNTTTSDGESPAKSYKSTTSNDITPDKEEKPLLKTLAKAAAVTLHNAQNTSKPLPVEEKKLLNTLAPSSSRVPLSSTPSTAAATAAALHKKGITMKKTVVASQPTPIATQQITTATSTTTQTAPSTSTSLNAQSKHSSVRVGGIMLEVGETIPLPESIKRKLAENQTSTPPPKKLNNSQTSTGGQLLTATNKLLTNTAASNIQQAIQIKQEPEDSINLSTATNSTSGINLITITSNSLTNGGGGGGACSSTAATVASTSTNGYSPRLEEMDFRNDIIFDAGNGSAMNGNASNASHGVNVNSSNTAGIINLGNFDNSLPPTFFKNLCNSSRHEALGLYVANVMNRLRPRSAAKLELGILRAIIDVQMDELEH